MDWSLEVTCPRGEVMEALYQAANVWCNDHLPTMMQAAKTPQEQIEAAQTADTVMYQIRSSVAVAIGLLGSISAPGADIVVELFGFASALHTGMDAVTVRVGKTATQLAPSTQAEENTTDVPA